MPDFQFYESGPFELESHMIFENNNNMRLIFKNISLTELYRLMQKPLFVIGYDEETQSISPYEDAILNEFEELTSNRYAVFLEDTGGAFVDAMSSFPINIKFFIGFLHDNLGYILYQNTEFRIVMNQMTLSEVALSHGWHLSKQLQSNGVSSADYGDGLKTLTDNISNIVGSFIDMDDNSPATILIDETITCTGYLKNANAETLANRTVHCLIDDLKVNSVTTDSNGEFIYGLSNLSVGNHTLKFAYLGEEYLSSFSRTRNITVHDYLYNNPNPFGLRYYGELYGLVNVEFDEYSNELYGWVLYPRDNDIGQNIYEMDDLTQLNLSFDLTTISSINDFNQYLVPTIRISTYEMDTYAMSSGYAYCNPVMQDTTLHYTVSITPYALIITTTWEDEWGNTQQLQRQNFFNTGSNKLENLIVYIALNSGGISPDDFEVSNLKIW